MSAISLHEFLAHIDFRQVAYIESVFTQVTSGDAAPDAPVSSIAFIGASTLLTAQPLEYFRTLARGQMLEMGGQDGNTGAQERLVPIAAIHHLELVGEAAPSSPGAVREGAAPVQAKIVYRAYDPACPEKRFQMQIPASVIDDLLDSDRPSLIDIGRGNFVFADEVEDARPLEPWQIARLAREKPEDGSAEPPVSLVHLRGGEFIPSSFPARAIEGMLGRILPSAGGTGSGRRSWLRSPDQPYGFFCGG